jgi:hypothetical protein
VRVIEVSALSFAVETIAAAVRDDAELERTVADFAAKPADGLIVLPDLFTVGNRDWCQLPRSMGMRIECASRNVLILIKCT